MATFMGCLGLVVAGDQRLSCLGFQSVSYFSLYFLLEA
jgi:hypothetical protein